ncbi:hypothetical protein PLICRDRAFT_44124 [Plicaturopsis crispa FD-325 SS-3]|nr:hypothetical protein PLICRDRAFT_44124 [Plicaturopsis crispa FD-325 SS-3]
MSALAVALAAFAVEPPQKVIAGATSDAQHLSKESTQDVCERASCSNQQPLTTSSCESSAPIGPQLATIPLRRNEHLAVLLPKHLWKPDSMASKCDNFYCQLRFSLFERRHHCRKCGGVFCQNCSSRVMQLLDTSNLSFIHPPRNVPISAFESPNSPVAPCRVCTDCWDQVNGTPRGSPRSPSHSLPHSAPISVTPNPLQSESSSLSSSVSTPPNGLPPMPKRALRGVASNSQLSLRRANTRGSLLALSDASSSQQGHTQLIPEPEPSYGELDAYPLRRASALCKLSGGGRWVPKHELPHPGYRIPGGKALFEIEMDREEEAERLRRLNPVVHDGDFQYRFLCHPPPSPILSASPYQMSAY